MNPSEPTNRRHTYALKPNPFGMLPGAAAISEDGAKLLLAFAETAGKDWSGLGASLQDWRAGRISLQELGARVQTYADAATLPATPQPAYNPLAEYPAARPAAKDHPTNAFMILPRGMLAGHHVVFMTYAGREWTWLDGQVLDVSLDERGKHHVADRFTNPIREFVGQ